MNRRNLILIGVLVLQLVVAAVVFWPRATASETAGQSLFPGVEADRIVGLTMSDAEGKSIQLARSADGWVLPEAGDYPCQEEKVPVLLTKIVGLKADRLVTQTSSSHKRLKVAEDAFERRIEFELADGTRHRLYLGTSPSFRAIHVRADSQDQVYLTSDLTSQDAAAEAADWVNQDYLSVPAEQIVAVTLENANGRFEFEKGGDTWTMKGLAAGEALNEGAVEALVNRAALTTLLQPLGKEDKETYGLQKPNAIVTIQTHSDEAGDKTYTLWVGAKDAADNSYVVKSSGSEYYVRVSEYSAQDLVEKGRADFLQLPPTPTPGAPAEATPQG
jgi:hypothetical protein